MKKLATIGDNCIDIYPQLNKAFSGGNAVNVAVYSTRYGMQPGCITWVGEDDFGNTLKSDLARKGVNISHVHTKAGETAQTQVTLNGNDRVFGDYSEGVMADFALSEEDYHWLAGYDIIHAAIWGHAEEAFPRLHAAGKTTSFDFSDKWDSPLWHTLSPHLDFAFASAQIEDEALRLRMKSIVAQGAGAIIVTLGENGSIAWDGRQFWRQTPQQVAVVDTMGAGDSFIAGFLCAWASGQSLHEAMQLGTASASQTIQYHGAW
ncbi:fructoselysine 6-kinase [Pseudocitrobacter cyperus]|uniref:Fructoselysine 6-kinase n=1 Tax=Pseudocitrobacter cyperus TaxID=3112843 RepID=A0ABV0HMN8_9ENTR